MVCRRDGARGQITEGIAKQYPGPSKTADLLVFTGENCHRRWHCLECPASPVSMLVYPLSFVRSAFHLRASSSLLVRAGQRSKRAHPATRKPAAARKYFSVTYGTSELVP